MKNHDVIIAHPQTSEQVFALKAFMNDLKIKFEITKEDNYKPEIDSIETCSLTKDQKNAIDDALKSIETKGTTPNNVIKEETRKRFPHLFNR
jgi:hypothetical protein